MSLSGAMCSVMMYSNLALGVTNQVTLEFSTPHGIAPDGVLLCATATDHRFDRSTFAVHKLEEGGSQFLSGASQTVAGVEDNDLLAVRAFSGATTWNHRPVEVGVAADVLGLDHRYAETYARRRFDDLVRDASGNSLDGVFQDPVWTTDAATRTAASDAVVAALSAATADATRAELLKRLEELNRPTGNCALLTGSWYKNTRYELTFSAPNPSASSSNLGWWMAPVSYAAPEGGEALGANGAEASHRVTYSVRGDVRGATCLTRASVSSETHDACATLLAGGSNALVAAAGNATACEEANVAANEPKAVAGMGMGVAAGACATGEARSWRYDGHCVKCVDVGGSVSSASNRNATVETCACPSTLMTVAAGAEACGVPRGPTATAATETALASELCATFTKVKEGLDLGATAGYTAGIGGGIASGAHAVASAVLDAFVAAGSSLVDSADIAGANATYRATMLFDERAPNDPSRRTGLKPSCQKCEKHAGSRSTFVDDYGVTATVRDVRFDAGHALRLIGYVLALKGYPCLGLYDEADPHASVLGGSANAKVCQAAVVL